MNETKLHKAEVLVSDVSRTFGSVVALDSVTFQVKPHTICGLLGSNGAGKTTLMALITGQDRPTSGSILINDESPFESARIAQESSFIRDNQRYPDDYKLKHALAAGKIFHPKWDEAFALKLAKQFAIPESTDVRKFSRGQFSALSIVLGLASRAELTVFDEPYLGLDIAARRRFYELLLEDFSAHPRTMIISTHLVEEMEEIFDQIVVLEKGKVRVNATPDELRSMAYEVSGATQAVAEFAQGKNVLSTRTVGSLASSMVLSQLTADAREQAQALRVNLSQAPIHDVVAAIGNSYEQETAS